jgi:multidrug efflux pump subunit AcrA (membrane-fusion protein)
MKKRNIIFLILCSFVALIFISCGNTKNNDITDDKKADRNIFETGELAAVDSRSFIMPRFGNYWYQMKIIGLLKHGTIVKAGDSIIQLDPTEIKKYIIERESQLETQLAVLEKLHVNQDNKMQELDSKLKNEIATFNLKKLELESSHFESERIRKIKNLEFEQAKINLSRVKRLIVLSKTINANDLKIEMIKTKLLKNEIANAHKILPQLTIRTPISGIFQIGNNRRTREMIKIGDDIYQGNNMGNVPDLKWMKVNTFINENDFLRIKPGQKVTVRLDALPKVSFKGEISYIGKLCHLKDEKSRQKVFDVEVKILKPDERLKPGMTVSCEFN